MRYGFVKLTKVDSNALTGYYSFPMQYTLKQDATRDAMRRLHLTPAKVAAALEVSRTIVGDWLSGAKIPRPDKLMRLGELLKLSLDELVETVAPQNKPVIAFRKTGSAKTTAAHIAQAESMGELLRDLVPQLPPRPQLRPEISRPSRDYRALQSAVEIVRSRVGIRPGKELTYDKLIGLFGEAGAVLVPVLWGEKKQHQNATHIRLREEDVTFVLLNLDVNLPDFKFWMAHELAHVYTPDIAGSMAGEDFADDFAGALIYPESCARAGYEIVSRHSRISHQITALRRIGVEFQISLYSVYLEIGKYAKAHDLPFEQIPDASLHGARQNVNVAMPTVSDALFGNKRPSAADYLEMAKGLFHTPFFDALKTHVQNGAAGHGYIQHALDLPVADAKALHVELAKNSNTVSRTPAGSTKEKKAR